MTEEGRNAPGQELQDYLDSLLGSPREGPSSEGRPAAPAPRPGGERRAALTRPAVAAEARERPSRQVPAPSAARVLPEFADPPRPLTFTLPPPPPVQAPLAEATETPAPAPVQQPAPRETRPAPSGVGAPAKPAAPAPAREQPAEQAPAATAEAPARRPAPAATEWLANGRPSWAQLPFEALLFKVGGLTLAVPLVELGTIYPISEELTPLFGQADWFMGLLPIKGVNIRTVDSARIVMPERYDPALQQNYRYVISINGVDWGLAVDNVDNAITLDPDQVRWRSERSKRPWLAGTVVEHMCALLDVSQLARMFYERDHRAAR